MTPDQARFYERLSTRTLALGITTEAIAARVSREIERASMSWSLVLAPPVSVQMRVTNALWGIQ